jgi:hypothetical protein
MFIVIAGIFIAMAIFSLLDRSLGRRRDERRELVRERREEQLQQLLQSTKKISSDQNAEESDRACQSLGGGQGTTEEK